MESKTVNYTLVGVFVLGMLIALLVSIAVLTGRTGATDRYTTTYTNVTGLQYGTQVMYEGYAVGQIEEIRPIQNPNGQVAFQVEMSVTEGWRIPDDSQAMIAAAGILSALNIDIRAGVSTTFLSPGDEIPSGPSADMFAVISSVAEQMGMLTEEGLTPLITDVQGIIADVRKTMNIIDTMLTFNAPVLLKDIQTITETVAEDTPILFDDLQDFTQRLNATLDRANSIVSDDMIADIGATTNNARLISEEALALTQDLQGMDEDLRALLGTVDQAIDDNRGDIDQSIEDLRYSLATISRHIGTITRNMEGTSRHMLEFSRQIRDNPGLLISGTSPRDDTAQ